MLSTVEPASAQQWTAQSHCRRGGAAEAVGLGQLLPQDLGDFRVALLEIMHVKVVARGVEEEARPAVGVYFGAERGWCARTLAWRRERARETGAGDRAEAVATGRGVARRDTPREWPRFLAVEPHDCLNWSRSS